MVKPAPVSKRAFLKGSVKESASNQLQPPNELSSKDLQRKLPQTSSILQATLSQRICKGKWLKPSPASKLAFLKGFAKETSSNQLQTPGELFSKDLQRKCIIPAATCNRTTLSTLDLFDMPCHSTAKAVEMTPLTHPAPGPLGPGHWLARPESMRTLLHIWSHCPKLIQILQLLASQTLEAALAAD